MKLESLLNRLDEHSQQVSESKSEDKHFSETDYKKFVADKNGFTHVFEVHDDDVVDVFVNFKGGKQTKGLGKQASSDWDADDHTEIDWDVVGWSEANEDGYTFKRGDPKLDSREYETIETKLTREFESK